MKALGSYQQRTIVRDLIVGLTLSITIGVSLMGLVYYLHYMQSHKRDLEERLKTISDELSQVLVSPLWHMDNLEISQISNAYLSSEYLSGLRVISDTGLVFEKPPSISTNHISKTRTLYKGDIKVGIIELYFTDAATRDVRKAIIFPVIFTNLIIIIIIIMATHFILRQRLYRPLQKLVGGVRSISKGYYRKRMSPVPQADINNIITEVNTMAEQIAERTEQLAESEKKYRNIFENAAEGIFQSTPAGQFIGVNPAMAAILGYETPEDVTESVTSIKEQVFYLPRQYAALMDRLESMDTITNFECRLKRKGIEVIWASIHAHAIRDESGRMLMVEGLMEDISDRKAAETALAAEKEKLSAALREMNQIRLYLKNVLDSMPSVIIGVDADGTVTQWNREAEHITGMAAEQAQGNPLPTVFSDLNLTMDVVRQSIDLQAASRMEKITTRIDGQRRFLDIMIYPLTADDVRGAVIRMDDVTTRIQIEEVMVQTEKMISVGGLAAGMAHEINNPLSGILQSIQNILMRVSPEYPKNSEAADKLGLDLVRVNDYLRERKILDLSHMLRDSAIRASEIVKNMLAFSRKSDEGMMPEDLAELIDRTVDLAAHDYDLRKKYDFRHVEIIREYTAELTEVPCHKTEIEQVILNLLRNAAQAMMAEGIATEFPRIILRLKTDNEFAMIEVEDNGPGLSEEIRKRAFDPFFTTKSVGVGTGLGLSVSYFIITNNHHGSISVYSEPDKGARFTIRLPLKPR